jgi:hypothetical protein
MSSWHGAYLSTGTRCCKANHNAQPENAPSYFQKKKKKKLPISKSRVRWAGNVAGMEEMRDAYKMVLGKLEGERRLG